MEEPITILTELYEEQAGLEDFECSRSLWTDLIHREGRRELKSMMARTMLRHAEALLEADQVERVLGMVEEALAILRSEQTRTGRQDLADHIDWTLDRFRGIVIRTEGEP